jgi:hypothetical protein
LGEDAVEVFKDALLAYQTRRDDVSFATLEELVTDARRIAGKSRLSPEEASAWIKQLTRGLPLPEMRTVSTMGRQVFLILGLWNDRTDKDIRLRCLDTGKTEEQLTREDREAQQQAEDKRQRGEKWRAQGLCFYCGGQIGLFKKCKSCGRRN